jgi:hypothetical protein
MPNDAILRRLHRWLGVSTLLVFLASGAYMRLVAHPSELSDHGHLMYLSRHIYILAIALVHLTLASYLTMRSTSAGRAVQWVASAFLCASSLLLVAAFVVEPVAGRERTFVSTYGLYTLFAGTLLHFTVASRRDAVSR